ncbi:hypothetical protein M2459_001200 [Parabacteroides sp. PF5-5]|uniref:porin family protein n=1 Tax=unclassified Parabacteroides TaxID=2649774 RepID=UPI002475E0C4|nr:MULTISPECIES: porin family protein [unclassified Parabacteroides]MDH6304467.1 hypothetical protein [Parabacteroides sp. PH5-39]MDH6315380.1 hypothetical protein [Parabacteroides sp. PF5-13]MDH6319126.1 hypothetical protein [Parabacteroides sp. PH5-13]MDH6322856.1 hypothetical protein [Parabacteroides sp. PH5-8]MDH6326572.1 hypothetical protein [Parabacteroides sp. PH5-41]
MIKRFFIILLILPACILVHGQNAFKRELSIGPSFGMGVSSVTFSPKVQTNQMLGSHFGITGRWITENHLGLILELNYSQEGWDEKFDDPAYEYSRRINYINIPFLTHIYFGSKRVRFVFNVGPQVGYAVSESTTENVSGLDFLPGPNSSTYTTAQRSISVEKKFSWGICGGPGLEFRTGIGSFMLEGRYYYGLGDIFNSRKSDHFSKSSTQVMLGKLTYLIPIK